MGHDYDERSGGQSSCTGCDGESMHGRELGLEQKKRALTLILLEPTGRPEGGWTEENRSPASAVHGGSSMKRTSSPLAPDPNWKRSSMKSMPGNLLDNLRRRKGHGGHELYGGVLR